jgi:Mn-dependent DtxR family transcriptional regulator
MGRGRNPSVTSDRLLVELLLHRDRAAFSSEIADRVPVGQERVRQILKELSEQGLVRVDNVSGTNVYRLTDDGFDEVSTLLRDEIE